MDVTSYDHNDLDEALLNLVKDFNLLVEDGDLLKEDNIGTEEADMPFTVVRNRAKQIIIEQVYSKFRLCLKGEVMDTLLKFVEDQPILAAANNRYVVENIETNQKGLVKSIVSEEAIEDLNKYLQNT